MFTKSTKKFGVWRETRYSLRENYKIFTRSLIFSFSIAALIAWTVTIISMKIREEFFKIESSPQKFLNMKDLNLKKSAFFFRERKSALSLYVKMKENKLKVFFESGKYFILPDEGNNLLNYIEEKKSNIMLTYMLMRIEDPSISRVKIWSDNEIPFAKIKYLTQILSQYGYDSFDFAVER